VRIFERIDAHDPPGAEEAMRQHLADSERRLVATATRQSRRLR
jgi:DNA-binding GntR family transcriptional regulator